MADKVRTQFEYDTNRAIQNVGKLANRMEDVVDRMDQMERKSEGVRRKVQQLGDRSSAIQKMGERFAITSKAVGFLEKGLGGALAKMDEMVDKSKEFQTAFRDLRFFKTGQTTREKMTQIQSLALLAGQPIVPTAETIEQFVSKTGSAAFTQKRREEFLNRAFALSRVTKATPGQLGDIFSRTGEFYRQAGGRQLSNLTFDLLQQAAAKSPELAGVLPRFTAAGKAAGLTLPETMGFASFATQKVEGIERAATGFEALVRTINDLTLKGKLGMTREMPFMERLGAFKGMSMIELREAGVTDEAMRLVEPLAKFGQDLKNEIARARKNAESQTDMARAAFDKAMKDDQQFRLDFTQRVLEAQVEYLESFSVAGRLKAIAKLRDKVKLHKNIGAGAAGVAEATGGLEIDAWLAAMLGEEVATGKKGYMEKLDEEHRAMMQKFWDDTFNPIKEFLNNIRDDTREVKDQLKGVAPGS